MMSEWTADKIEDLMAGIIFERVDGGWRIATARARAIIAALKDNGLHIVPIPKPIADEIEGDMA